MHEGEGQVRTGGREVSGRRRFAVGAIAVLLAAATSLALLGRARSEAPIAEAPEPALGVRVRVEVLNGGGRDGVARSATDVLRDAGFDVVFFGNARSFDQDSSVVVDRVGELEWARAVADALGIPIVRSDPDPNLYLDVSVVLGRDWVPPDTEME